MKRRSNQKGAAMLLALFTVIVLASIATGFLAITIAENKTSNSKIDSDLALEAAMSGIDYLAMVATSQQNFWDYGPVSGRNGSISHPRVLSNPTYFLPSVDSTTYYMVYDLVSGSANGTNPPSNVIRLSLGDTTPDGKIVGCTIMVHDDPNHYPDITATSAGFVINSPGTDPKNVNLASSTTVFYASRSVQAILKEVSYYNYTYIYKNFTDLDLPFNVPTTSLTAMQNMVGLCPDTVINGGIRADGYNDPNVDPNSNRVARLLLWNADGTPVDSTSDPNEIATINGPVRLVSNDNYDNTGPEVVDAQIGNYTLNESMKKAFQGSSFVTGAEHRGIPGANSTFMPNIIDMTNGNTVNASTRYAENTDNNCRGISIYNGDIYQDSENTASNREDLDQDGNKDYSKNICKMTFYTDPVSGVPKVDVAIYNRYNSGSGKNSGDIATITGGSAISTNSYDLTKNTVIYVKGGNTLVEGEIASGVTVVCDDSRTAPTNTTGSIDDILPDPNSYTYTPDAASGSAADIENKNKFFRNLECENLDGTPTSEGNIFVTGDVTYKGETTSAMGLIAENYMYLHELKTSTSDEGDDLQYFADHYSSYDNDTADYHHLQLRGQLNSIRQSVQFDFFNYLGESGFYNAGGAGSEGFNGSIDFKGQMVGNQTDVEGDVKGRGYASDMSIGYDESLKYYTAPMFFNEDYRQVPSGLLQFTITAFFDKGSLGSK